jgi:hypothetical protein
VRSNRPWLVTALLVALIYPLIGITFALPAHGAATRPWRLAAWLASAVVFAAHLRFEHSRVRDSPSRAALHVSAAVAMGAFLLAVWINVHLWFAGGQQSPRALLALPIFPLVTGSPAFVAGLVLLFLFARIHRP